MLGKEVIFFKNKIIPQRLEKAILQNEGFWKIRIMDILTLLTFVFGLGVGYQYVKGQIETLKEIRIFEMNNLKESIQELKLQVKDVQNEIKQK